MRKTIYLLEEENFSKEEIFEVFQGIYKLYGNKEYTEQPIIIINKDIDNTMIFNTNDTSLFEIHKIYTMADYYALNGKVSIDEFTEAKLGNCIIYDYQSKTTYNIPNHIVRAIRGLKL